MITRSRKHLWGILIGGLLVLLSICTLAAPTDPHDAAAQLRQKLADLMAHPALHGAQVGACVVSLPDGEVLYSLNPHQSFIPASTIKLLVTASAVRLLGPDFVYHTSVWTPAAPTEWGQISGDLIIAGTADPAANAATYTDIARQLRSQGIRWVGGGIVGAGAMAASEQDKGLKAAHALHQALGGKGIWVEHGVSQGAVPPGGHLVYWRQSVALRDYLRAVNMHSDNRRASLLLSSLLSSFGNPHDPDHSFVAELWHECGLDTSALRLIEGSGRSHHNKLTPALLTGVLVEIARDEHELEALADSLPVAGVRGTLSGRMCGTVAEGRIYAKTGTLKKVSCLAGYVYVEGSPTLAFTLMMSGYSCSLKKARAIQDQVAVHLARYALADQAGVAAAEPQVSLSQ